MGGGGLQNSTADSNVQLRVENHCCLKEEVKGVKITVMPRASCARHCAKDKNMLLKL